jgi:hypothetical protein
VPTSHEQQTTGIAVLVAFGAISAILVGLVVWQPPAASWLAQGTQAELSNAPDEVTPIRLAAGPGRKPIRPGAWAEVINSDD